MKITPVQVKKYNKIANKGKKPIMVRVGSSWYTWYEGDSKYGSAFLTSQSGRDIEFDFDRIDDVQVFKESVNPRGTRVFNGGKIKLTGLLTETFLESGYLPMNESGILYRAGVKKYGKEGMTKIQQAAGQRKSHAEIGAIKDKYEKNKNEELNEMGYSSTNAQTQVNNDIKLMSNVLGKASQSVIKIMMGGVKDGKYDAMDLSKGIQGGDVSRMHFGEADFLTSLWTKMRDKLRKYSKGKLRR
jgi:hypothetical protein